MGEKPKRRCRCKERGEAMKRATIALIKGERETWKREMAFVHRTLVEDLGKMGNLALSSGDAVDFTKGVVSVWFRIPAATAAAATAAPVSVAPEALTPNTLMLAGVIPLLTWGSQLTNTVTDFASTPIHVDPPLPEGDGCFPVDSTLSTVSGTHTYSMPPSYIGVKVGDGAIGSGSEMTLNVHIQTTAFPTTVNTDCELTGYVFIDNIQCLQPVFNEVDSASQGMPEYYGNSKTGDISAGGTPSFGAPVIIGTDLWHHVLLSWDITGSSGHGSTGASEISVSDGVDSYSKMWCAVDDVNKSGFDLPAMWPGRDDDPDYDANASLSYAVAAIAGETIGCDDTTAPTVSTAAGDVAFYPFSIPSALTLERDGSSITPNLKVDMAELQVFAGVSLDTSVEDNRRAFITSDGVPASSALAQALMEQTPRILLHGSSNWKVGINTGSVGSFERTGTISTYTPNPGD